MPKSNNLSDIRATVVFTVVKALIMHMVDLCFPSTAPALNTPLMPHISYNTPTADSLSSHLSTELDYTL